MTAPNARFWWLLGVALFALGTVQVIINLLRGDIFLAACGALQAFVGIALWLLRERLAKHRG